MRRAQILATATFLPGDPITNDRIAALVGPLPEEVAAGIDIYSRHWIANPETGEHAFANSEMAATAAERAVASAGVELADVDLLVISTSSPDQPLPPMSTLVMERLGLTACTVIDIRSGCAGAAQAMDVARLYLESGSHRLAVVVGSEAISPLIVPLLRAAPGEIRVRDRLVAYVFGDGAGAVVLAAADGDGLEASAAGCLGLGRKPGLEVIGGGTAIPLQAMLTRRRPVELRLDAVGSARHLPELLATALAHLGRSAGGSLEGVAACVVPEANAPFLTEELRACGLMTKELEWLEGRALGDISQVAATGSAALPIAIDQAWRAGQLLPGTQVALVALESSKWLYSALLGTWTAPTPARLDPVG